MVFFFILSIVLGLGLVIAVDILGLYILTKFEPSMEYFSGIYFLILAVYFYICYLFKKVDILKSSFLIAIYTILMVLLVNVNSSDNVNCDGTPRIYSLTYQLSFDVLAVVLVLLSVWQNISIKGSIYRKLLPITAGVGFYVVLFKFGFISDVVNPIISEVVNPIYSAITT